MTKKEKREWLAKKPLRAFEVLRRGALHGSVYLAKTRSQARMLCVMDSEVDRRDYPAAFSELIVRRVPEYDRDSVMYSRRLVNVLGTKNKARVEEWNARYPVGTVVDYWSLTGCEGEPLGRTTTRTEALLSSSGDVVIYLVGVRSYWSLDAITPVQRHD